MKLKLHISNERIIALLLGLISIYLYLSELSTYFDLFFLRLIIYPTIYSLGVIAYYRSIKIKPNNILILLGFILVLILSSVFFPAGTEYLIGANDSTSFFLSDLFLLTFISFPIFTLTLCTTNSEKLINELNRIGRLIIVLFIATFAIKALIKHSFFDYMNISYGVLPWILYSKKNRNKGIYILRIISLIFIAISGCRGALLTTIIFYFLYFLLSKMTFKKIIKILLMFIGLFIIVLNLNVIVQKSYYYLKEIGFKSRTLELYLDVSVEQGLSHYSDRANLQIPLIEKLNIVGYGLFGDRVISYTHQYAHNLFLELLIEFGIPIGSILCIILLILIINSTIKLYKTTEMNRRILICVALSFICCKYMFSASYLHLPEFWFFLALLISISKNVKILYNNKGEYNG